MSASGLEPLMTRFAARWNLDPLTSDAEGRYRLRIDGRLDVSLFQHGGEILLEGSLGPLPQEDPPDRLMWMLRLQLGTMSGQEAVLALAPEDETLMLFSRLPAGGQTLVDLERALEGFINQLERWTRELSRHSPSSLTSPPIPTLQLFFP